jgi:hypothetical protein
MGYLIRLPPMGRKSCHGLLGNAAVRMVRRSDEEAGHKQNSRMSEFRGLVGGLKEGFEAASEAGCLLAKIVMSEPGWLGEVVTQMVYPPNGDFIPRGKDVLHLPLPADVSDFARGGFKRQFDRGHGRQTAKEKREKGVLAWMFLVIVNLNVNWGGFGNVLTTQGKHPLGSISEIAGRVLTSSAHVPWLVLKGAALPMMTLVVVHSFD